MRTRRKSVPGRKPAAPDALLFGATVTFLVIWIVFGGGEPGGPIGFTLSAISGSALLGLALQPLGRQVIGEQRFAAKLFAGLTLAIPLLQLVPLPPGVWHALPGRMLAVETLATVGAAGDWRPLTLSTLDTLETALVCWWLFGLALALLQLSPERLRQVLLLVTGLALLHIAIGVVQVVTRGGWLSFYRSSHTGFLIGLFANKNHSGLFIALAILTGYGALRRPSEARRGGRSPLVFAAGPALLVALAALFATNSRAALLFGAFALGLVALLVWDRRVGKTARLATLGVLAGVCIVAVFSSTDIATRSLGRFGIVGSDIRWLFWQRSWPLVDRFFPVGAGIGSFATLFAAAEQLDWVKPTYFNHAHNEYLEQLIEIGILAPLLWAACVAATVPPAIAAWRTRARTEGGLAVIGAAIVFVMMVHSSFDYPLRRPATAATFVVGLSLLLRAGRKRVV